MVRPWLILCLLAGLSACSRPPVDPGPRYKLAGFTLVDPAARSERVADLWVVDGVLATKAPVGAESWPVIQGKGRWLLPGFWDLGVGVWGNSSAYGYQVLAQSMSPEALLGSHLYAGVTRVSVFAGIKGRKNGYFNERRRRCEALGIPAAKGGGASQVLMGPRGEGFMVLTMTTQNGLDAAMDRVLPEEPDYVQLVADVQGSQAGFGLRPELLKEAIRRTHASGLKAVVAVANAVHGHACIALGADALRGGHFGAEGKPLFQAMAAHGIPWMIQATALDLEETEGPGNLAEDPLALALVDRRILASFGSLGSYSPDLRRIRAEVLARLSSRRAELALAAQVGTSLIAVSEAGWIPCSFQGAGLHRSLIQLGRSGVPAYQALAAVTTIPAAWLGQRAGFKDGDPADLVALEADPVLDLSNSEKISGVCIAGVWPDRERLKPDLWRRHY